MKNATPCCHTGTHIRLTEYIRLERVFAKRQNVCIPAKGIAGVLLSFRGFCVTMA